MCLCEFHNHVHGLPPCCTDSMLVFRFGRYVIGDADENELILSAVLQAFNEVLFCYYLPPLPSTWLGNKPCIPLIALIVYIMS